MKTSASRILAALVVWWDTAALSKDRLWANRMYVEQETPSCWLTNRGHIRYCSAHRPREHWFIAARLGDLPIKFFDNTS